MKCGKCFFCFVIGKGIYGDFKVLHCRLQNRDYKIPEGTDIWHIGCKVHPQTVAKAKRQYMKKLTDDVLRDANKTFYGER